MMKLRERPFLIYSSSFAEDGPTQMRYRMECCFLPRCFDSMTRLCSLAVNRRNGWDKILAQKCSKLCLSLLFIYMRKIIHQNIIKHVLLLVVSLGVRNCNESMN